MDLLTEVEKLLKWKKSKQYIADKVGATLEEVELAIKDLREGKSDLEPRRWEENLKTGEAELTAVVTEEIRTLEDLIKKTKIDTDKWSIDKYVQNFWGSQDDPKYQVKAWLSPKEVDFGTEFMDFLKSYKSDYKPLPINKNPNFSDPVCLLLSLADFHLGKGDRIQVPLETRLKEYKTTIDTLLHRSYHSHNIDEIVFVVGNDMFQTDTIAGTTVKLTKVSESERWDSIYEVGFDLMVETITKLKQFCNKLNIVLTPGNHSESKEYYLTHALEVYFKQDKNIRFNRTSDKYKCHVYGETALFFNHGDNIQDKLPLMFAQTFRKEWGQTKYHEIILGDRHHNSEKTFRTSQGEAQGVRMRILPSLTNLDQWHYDNLYTNAIQAGIALVYDKEKGKISEFEHRI